MGRTRDRFATNCGCGTARLSLTLGAGLLAIVSCGPQDADDTAWSSALVEVAEQVAAVASPVAGRALSWDGNFLKAAEAVPDIFENAASYTFRDQVVRRCDRTVVTSVRRKGSKTVVAGRLEGTDCTATFTLTLRPIEGALGFRVAVGNDPALNRLTLRVPVGTGVGIFGLGVQYSHVNFQGLRVPVWSEEQGIGRGAEPLTTLAESVSPGAGGDAFSTYAPVPYFVTTEGQALALDTTTYSVFDFQTPGEAQVELWDTAMVGRLYSATSVRGALRGYTRFAGRMAPLPEWLNQGAVVRMGEGSAAVRERVARLEAAGVPLAAIWIEDWVGERRTELANRLWWNWEPDATLYPDWPELVAELRARGIRVLTYFNPYLVDPTAKANAQRNLFAEADAQGFLVRTADGTRYALDQGGFEAAVLDLTEPAARTWLKSIMKAQIALGVSGWMADFGEGFPLVGAPADGQDPFAYHNRFPTDWAALNREVLQETGTEGDAVFFSRAGYTRSPGLSTLFWLGDQTVTFDGNDGLATVVRGLLSGGLSGFTLNHSDIGGYSSFTVPGVLNLVRTPELLERWMELAAFTAVFRTHETSNRVNNLQVDSTPALLVAFARWARVYQALAPYRTRLMRQAHRAGLPVVRPLLLEFPDDPAVTNLDAQFMLGSQLLVAPVLEPGADAVPVYLPRGPWVHVFTGQQYGSSHQGVTVVVPAPLGEPAVLYRMDSSRGARLARGIRRAAGR